MSLLWSLEGFWNHQQSTHQAEPFMDDGVEDHIASEVNWVDYLAIAIYFLVVAAVGIWSSRKRDNTVDSYFLAGRQMHWIPVGASLFASNLGSEHFVGLTGSGASAGIGNVAFEYNAMYVLLVLGWVFMPVYMAANVSTMPEYLRKRYGGERIRVYLSLLALILYIFTKISSCLFAGALFIKLLLNLDNIYVAILILLAISALFTILGGLNAVIWTDFMQVVIMLIGAAALAIMALIKVGGYHELMSNFRQAGLPTNSSYESYKGGCDPAVSENCSSCSEITPYYHNLFRPATDSELPWPGHLGIWISATWYWCTDQVIVQRGLSAKNLSYSKLGCVLAALTKVFPMFLLIIPGMAARVLWPNQIGCSNPIACERICGSPSGCTNLAYPYLVIKLMPVGATGLMVSVIIAALMSSLTSIFNSASTIFIIDIYNRFRKRASELEQIIVGRFFVLFLVGVSVVWIPILEGSQNSQLFTYIQSVTSFLAPPVCAVYLLSLFWSRTTEPAAFWSLVIGLVFGLIRMVLEFAISAPACSSPDPDLRPTFVSRIHFLHFGIILFVTTLAVAVVISLFTEKIDERKLYRLTFATIHSDKVREELEDTNANEDSDPQQKNRQELETWNTESGVTKWISLICCAGSGKSQKGDSSDDSAVTESNKTDYNFEQELTPEEQARIHADSARDDPSISGWVNAGGVLVILVCTFFWGLYA